MPSPSPRFRLRTSALVNAALLLALTATAALAQSPKGRALAIEDYYRVKTIGAVQLTPDAKWVTFTVTTRVEETNGTTEERWIVPADGSAPARPFTDADTAIVSFGLRLVNAAGAPGRGGRGAGAGAMAGNAFTITSPDGKFTATVRDTPPPRVEKTYASDFEKRHEERFKGVQFDWVEFHRDGAPFPLPNAKDPQVNPPQEIFLRPAGGGATYDTRQLTTLGLRPTGTQWSPDGTTLLFTADSLYRRENSYGRSEIFTVTTSGTVRRLTPNPDYGYTNARFSPDGRWILATKQLTTDAIIRKKLNHGGATDLVVMPAAGGAERNLTANWDYIPAAAQWSPDGKFVYFTGGIGGTTHLFRVSPEGGAVQQVTTGQRRLGDFAFDKAMTKVAFTVGLKESPSEISVANIDGTNERQLTHVHDAFTSEVALSRAERLQFTSADGTPVEGWLTYPYGYSKADGAKYPLIVSNHGGPHSAIEYGFDFKNQYFAADGYFVLEVNFRSSTGYGEKFLWGTWGAWGTKDGQDVMAGVDYALSRYPIDRKRVASIGHSYGGFMTNWLITQYPSRFAAAVSGAGIVNWTSDFGNADIPRTKETEFLGSPWEEKARNVMIRQSPLTYAGRAKAPTLFINGEIDQRVPFSENMQLFVALKKNGVPAKMIEYANMPHAITGSWNVVHRMLNERRWLDTYMRTAQ